MFRGVPHKGGFAKTSKRPHHWRYFGFVYVLQLSEGIRCEIIVHGTFELGAFTRDGFIGYGASPAAPLQVEDPSTRSTSADSNEDGAVNVMHSPDDNYDVWMSLCGRKKEKNVKYNLVFFLLLFEVERKASYAGINRLKNHLWISTSASLVKQRMFGKLAESLQNVLGSVEATPVMRDIEYNVMYLNATVFLPEQMRSAYLRKHLCGNSEYVHGT